MCPPSAALAVALEGASGPGWRCAGASRDELIGLLHRWAALEARAAAGRLGVLRALIRDDGQPLPGGGYHGDLPDGWTKSLTHEVAAALAVSVPAAEAMMWLAWDLQVRLPGIAGLLADGTVAYAKARAVDDAFQLLGDADAARAEAMILAELPGKNFGQVKRLAEQAAVTVDPGSAARRREDAERHKSRVTIYREDSGALALCGRDLPTDEALSAHAQVCARALEYKKSRAFPGDTRMDQFRAAAYVDLLNGTAAAARIASGVLPGTSPTDETDASADVQAPDGSAGDAPTATEPSPANADVQAPDGSPRDEPTATEPSPADADVQAPDGSVGDELTAIEPSPVDADVPAPNGSAGDAPTAIEPSPDVRDADRADGPDAHRPGDEGPRGSREAEDGDRPPRSPGSPPPSAHAGRLPRPADLVIPLVTLLGLADRPGEGHGLGPLDPELCRALAASAAISPFSRLCVTVTDPHGIAIGHGCAKSARSKQPGSDPGANGSAAGGPDGTLTALPARLNLTIPVNRLRELANRMPASGPPVPWAFTRQRDPGPPGGFGTWTLALPDGSQLAARLEPVPTYACDHRHESHAYQPNDTLRHLVQVRDGDLLTELTSAG